MSNISKLTEDYPNIEIYENNENITSQKNYALNISEGKLVNFLEVGSTFSSNTLKSVYAFFKNYEENTDMIMIPTKFINSNKKYLLDYAFEKTQIINLNRHPNYPFTTLDNIFIRKNSVKTLFNENI